MNNKVYDVIIAGGGPAGYTAALYAARSGYTVAVVEQLSAGGQMATTEKVENYPGFEDGIDGFELGERMRRGAERFGAVSIYARIKSLDLEPTPKKIETSSGVLFSRAVVVATGAKPRLLGIEGERELTGRGVAYCAACDGMRYKGKTVVVAGGGNSAAADALYLSKICEKVYLVHRRDRLRASRVYYDALKKSGVEILFDSRVVGLESDKVLTGVAIEDVVKGDRREIPCAALFVAVGRQPETDLVKGQLALDENGYITADETTKTSIEGVFAVGDVRTKPLRQIVTAAADGATCSRFLEEFLK
ncbi:MAG: thioredoxin-disulfide reductase [Clostridia bacterium]|nr:thioredoxin-disulfide reductase [Clostridia bacterium]